MPEQPELDAAASRLREHLLERRIERLDVAAINVLRTATPPADSLAGRRVTAVTRRGKHLLLEAEGRTAVLHLALAGWLRHHPQVPAAPARTGSGPLALRLVLEDGSALDVTEQGRRKSAALWVTDDPSTLETIARLGPEARDLDADAFTRILAATGSHAKTVLTEQRAMAGIGNAWSDEILHRARLSPFAPASGLGPERTAALFAAQREVLDEASSALADVPLDRIKRTKKARLRVHGRTGEPCPRCGTPIAEVSFVSKALQYCPACQTGGRRLNDRRMDRLLG